MTMLQDYPRSVKLVGLRRSFVRQLREFFYSDLSGLGIKDAPGGIPATGCRGWYPFQGHSFPGNERRNEYLFSVLFSLSKSCGFGEGARRAGEVACTFDPRIEKKTNSPLPISAEC